MRRRGTLRPVATTPLPDGTVELNLHHQGRDRTYLLRVPDEPAEAPPLVLQLHGRGIDARKLDGWTRYSALADEAGFVLAMPSAIDDIWNDGRYRGVEWAGHAEVDDVGYLLAVVDDVGRRLPIDPSRIYVLGMSNGATMAGRLAWEHGDRLSAIAQIGGTVAVDVMAQPGPVASLPVLEIHGTRDRGMPYGGGQAGLWRLIDGRPVGSVLGVDDWARVWIERNGLAAVPSAEVVAPDVSVRRWSSTASGPDVVFYRIEGGGHTWPGAPQAMPDFLGRMSPSLNASRTSWEFLAAHRREPPGR
jgi:polyhydroxybutyrate depolymerase